MQRHRFDAKKPRQQIENSYRREELDEENPWIFWYPDWFCLHTRGRTAGAELRSASLGYWKHR